MGPDRCNRLGARSVSGSAHLAGDTRCPSGAAVPPAMAQASVAALGAMHRYAAHKAATALASAETRWQAAQCTAPVTIEQVTALHQLRQAFLRMLLLRVQAAGETIIDELKHGSWRSPLTAPAQQPIDQLVVQYLDQVHTILRR